jgi:hypothetical protein
VKIIAAILILIATQSAALSCLRPDTARAFQAASEAPSAYVVLLGRFAFDAANLPPAVTQGDPAPATITARFVGNGLTLQGFTSPQDRDITLEITCAGPWCGTLQPDTPVMAFARKDGDDYTVAVDPCGGWVFPEPTDDTLNRVIACLRGAACEPSL